MDTPPLAIDLFCGLGGWTEGLLMEGYRVIGFDNQRHAYGHARYPGRLVIQDVLTLHGSQFKAAALIVASPPCQEYSYRAMPWKRAKALPPPDNTFFETCFRIQQEAEDAAGGPIPMVVENVRGAQKWVGRARWHYGSFYLWGDVPALMPITKRAKVGGLDWKHPDDPRHRKGQAFNPAAQGRAVRATTKNSGGSWFNVAHNTTSGRGRNPVNNRIANAADGCKQGGSGAAWFDGEVSSKSSKSSARKAASAHIAKIPLPLARWIGRAWYPLQTQSHLGTIA